MSLVGLGFLGLRSRGTKLMMTPTLSTIPKKSAITSQLACAWATALAGTAVGVACASAAVKAILSSQRFKATRLDLYDLVNYITKLKAQQCQGRAWSCAETKAKKRTSLAWSSI